jgi:hypothetical protein
MGSGAARRRFRELHWHTAHENGESLSECYPRGAAECSSHRRISDRGATPVRWKTG